MKTTVAIGVVLSLGGLILLTGCRTNMPPSEVGDAGSRRKVLIAAEDTSFKRRVVAATIDRLGADGWYFRIIGLDQLPEVVTEKYGAVLLVAGFRAGRIDDRVSSFLGKSPASPKAIVFFTRGTEAPFPENAKPDIRVDVLSSASRTDRVMPRAEELAAFIQKKFR